MEEGDGAPREGGAPIGSSVAVFLSLGVVAAAITTLFLGMRSVMSIGGSCASGNPAYVIAHPCPKGVPLLIVGGIWVGLVGAGVYAWQTARSGAPSAIGLLWPALFLSLGWNFLDYGLHTPGGGGPVWGWLICAVVFGLMGGVPLLVVARPIARSFARGGREPSARSSPPAWQLASSMFRMRRTLGELQSQLVNVANPATAASDDGTAQGATDGTTGASAEAAGKPDDLVSALEHLDYLHRSGSLSTEEYGAAKRRLLGMSG